MRRGPGGGSCPLGIAVALLVACGGDDAEQDPPQKDEPEQFATSDADDTSDDGLGTPNPGEATDRCVQAPSVDEGRFFGTLRGNASVLGGACGSGGPDAFFRVDVPFRADVFVQALGVGFTPRVGVLPVGCAQDWTTRTLACTEGIGAWLTDIPAGASLVVSVGIDPEHPQLDLPAPGEGADPLSFALDVELRNVLDAGDVCVPASRGRCGTGTLCLTPEGLPAGRDARDDDAETGGVAPGDALDASCTVLDADTCASAEPLALPVGITTIALPAGVLHTDAHHHQCTGGHRPERVLALGLPPSNAERVLDVRTQTPGIGLALRGPACTPDDERACAEPSAGGASVSTSVGPLASDVVYVFIELPPPSAGEASAGTTGGADSGSETGEEPGEDPPPVLEVEVAIPSEG